MFKKLALIIALSGVSAQLAAKEADQGREIKTLPNVLSFKERVAPINDMVTDRLDNLLPKLMQEADLDMWLVINREYGEDKLFYTLVPQPTFAADAPHCSFFQNNQMAVSSGSVSAATRSAIYIQLSGKAVAKNSNGSV